VTDFLDSPLTAAECLIMQEKAPHLVVTTVDGDVVPACGVNRRTVAALQARYPTLANGQAPAQALAPTATERFPNSPGMSRGSK